MTLLVVDAANVVGSRPTGWWRDRPAAARELVDAIRTAIADDRLSQPVVVVLEGTARWGVEPGTADGVEVIHAPGEGDDAIAGRASAEGGPLVVVTADRALRDRVRRPGLEVVGPRWLLDRLSR